MAIKWEVKQAAWGYRDGFVLAHQGYQTRKRYVTIQEIMRVGKGLAIL